MNRRDFLAGGLGLAGYTLVVRTEAAEARAAAPVAPAPAQAAAGRPAPDHLAAEPHLALVNLDCDVLVAGGGMAGVCAALAAARHGAKVVLAQDRSRLGGNASSEVRMHIVGADCHGGRPGWREGGILEELRLEDAVRNPHRCWELWDLMLYDKVRSEPNLTLLLDSTVYLARVKAARIEQVWIRCDKSETLYAVRPRLAIDCTGDSRLGVEAGAELRHGREARSDHDEPLAQPRADRQTQGSSVLFTARDCGKPMPFTPPTWARKVTRDQLKFRGITSWEYGYWWIEWGGQLDTVRDHERIRGELLAIVLGVWDYIKNSGDHPSSANWALSWLGMVPGKRESRRLLGDHILTQHDVEGRQGIPADAVAIGGWGLDDHPPAGFDRPDLPPFTSIRMKEVYGIPFRCLYSRNVVNLLMAGRNISATHVAFTSARVMGTCSALGQAAGTAAAWCARAGITPRELAANPDRVRELRQALLRDDQTIKGLRNEDPLDLARSAQVTASAEHDLSKAAHVIDGFVRDAAGEWAHRWAAPVDGEGPWLQLAWPEPQKLRQLQLTFDTGFHRELTLSASDGITQKIVRGPQPETVRDYRVLYYPAKGAEAKVLLEVKGNYQRLNRHDFAPVEAVAVRIEITATNGDALARVYEVRCYG